MGPAMTNDDNSIPLVTERFERRLGEETGKLRLEMADLKTEMANIRTEMAHGFGELRAEMIRLNFGLLKWLLVFFVGQVAAFTALDRLTG